MTIKKLLLLFCILLPTALFSQGVWDDDVFDLENNPPPSYPFSVSGGYLPVSRTHFRTPGFEDKTLIYKQWDLAFAATYPCNDIAGFIFGAGWIGTEVKMQDNPAFHETNFNYINLSFGGFTRAFTDWTWTVTVAAFLDTEVFSLIDYTLYQGVLWGRYNLCKWLELDFGFILEVGLKKEKMWPIFGFVYTPLPNLRLNAVYPINISLQYDFLTYWTVAGSVRFLRNRHRVTEDNPNSQGIFEYRDTGAEFDLTFRPFDWFFIKGFVGSTFDGDLKVTNRNDKNAVHFKFNGSFYSGASAVLSY